LACPFCGARLLSKTAERPPRLICSNCGRVRPQPPGPSLLGWLDRHLAGLLVLLLLLAMPFSLLVVAPFLEGGIDRRQPRGAPQDAETRSPLHLIRPGA
jgi:hypothetical protein